MKLSEMTCPKCYKKGKMILVCIKNTKRINHYDGEVIFNDEGQLDVEQIGEEIIRDNIYDEIIETNEEIVCENCVLNGFTDNIVKIKGEIK